MNNEEKILSMLENLTKVVSQQGQLLDELDERSLRSAVMLENEVMPHLRLLYEGHGTILESLDSLAPKSRVEVLEDDVAMMKDVIKLMRQEIAELKKAQ